MTRHKDLLRGSVFSSEKCPNCIKWWLIDEGFNENADLPHRMREWCTMCTSVYRREMSMRGMTGHGE